MDMRVVARIRPYQALPPKQLVDGPVRRDPSAVSSATTAASVLSGKRKQTPVEEEEEEEEEEKKEKEKEKGLGHQDEGKHNITSAAPFDAVYDANMSQQALFDAEGASRHARPLVPHRPLLSCFSVLTTTLPDSLPDHPLALFRYRRDYCHNRGGRHRQDAHDARRTVSDGAGCGATVGEWGVSAV